MAIPVALPSPQLVEANRQLHTLRAQIRAQRQAVDDQDAGNRQLGSTEMGREKSHVAGTSAGRVQDVALITNLPPHLGWGSTPLTAVVRAGQAQGDDQSDEPPWKMRQHRSVPKSEKASVFQPVVDHTATVKVYPDIALGMLRQEQAAAGRIWLLARHLDGVGAGWLRIDIIKQHLTSKNSKFHVCGWRQLRNLLKQGEGIFWHRGKERLWLRSAAKVAHDLDVTQLTGRPVSVPVSALLSGIGDVRAHLYASFHSGRVKEKSQGVKATSAVWSPPIARDTLTAVSGVGRASQRTYESRTRTQVQHNFAVGETAEEVNRERCAWQQGQALFELKDYRGEQGRKGKTYLAWQLPNTYIGRHQQCPKGRQKRINRELKDLVMKGMPGNVERTNETPELAATSRVAVTSKVALAKRYYPNGKLAAQAYGRQVKPHTADQLYWRRHQTSNGRFRVWQKLGGGE